MRTNAIAWLGLAVALLLPGCGLTLDYGPPDLEGDDAGLDAATEDAGPVECIDDAVCDDGVRCTVDGCVAGFCTHVSLCPGRTECIARGDGECRLPCAMDGQCTDADDCSADTCAPDGHCQHDSLCDDTTRPVCLPGGACVPANCSGDVDCDDGNACNGAETCDAASSRCAAGAPMVCPAATGCMHSECDPAAGGCVQVPHSEDCGATECHVSECLPSGDCGPAVSGASVCDDGDSCTDDVCDGSGACTHTTVECDQTCASGAAPITCEPSTGVCSYATACGAGLVCTSSGCSANVMCTSDAACAGDTGPDGCPLRCVSGMCSPLTCAPRAGECGVLDVVSSDGLTCPAPVASMCRYSRSDAACTSPFHGALGTCNAAFACEYTCPRSDSCVTYVFDPAAGCVPVAYDSTFCAARGGPIGPGDCSRWVCTGATGNGCERQLQNAVCDDRVLCTIDTCMSNASGGGACVLAPSDARCDDGAECTLDTCEPGAGARDPLRGCRYVARDTVCQAAAPGLECASVYCVGEGAPPLSFSGTPLPSGCVASYSACAPSVGSLDGGIVTSDASVGLLDAGPPGAGARVCDLTTGMCRRGAACTSDPGCDDGDACNGTELCELGTCVQRPPPPMCVPQVHCGRFCVSGLCTVSASPSCFSTLSM